MGPVRKEGGGAGRLACGQRLGQLFPSSLLRHTKDMPPWKGSRSRWCVLYADRSPPAPRHVRPASVPANGPSSK